MSKKEKRNLYLLYKYFIDYGFCVFFWSLVDGICRRLGFTKLYIISSKKRRAVCKAYLQNRYVGIISKYVALGEKASEIHITEDSPIWVFWWQGLEKVPYPVDICVASIKRYAGKRKVNIISHENLKEYMQIPSYIEEKFQNGNITITHFSDYVRVCLLEKYGGLWVDSTFFWVNGLCSDMLNYSFYSIKHRGLRDWVASQDLWSIGFLATAPSHILMSFCREMFEEYWKQEDVEIAYLFSDYIISIGYDNIKSIRTDIETVPDNNLDCFVFLEKGNEECKLDEFNILMKKNQIFQISYKVNWIEKINGKDTFFSKLIHLEGADTKI